MSVKRDIFREGIVSGICRGWGSFIWVLKILVPISFLTALLEWSGVFNRIDFLMQPVMSWFGLPAIAALPLMIGLITGIYGGIAAMVVLPFTKEQMTLMAIFMMIAHNLIQEGLIQGKSGFHPLKAVSFRLGAAILTVMVVGQMINSAPMTIAMEGTSVLISPTFVEILKTWSISTLHITAKIFVIMMGVLTLLEMLKTLGWIPHIVSKFTPFLRLLGLSQKVGILWITGAVFGLAYGAAVIFEEIKEGNLTREELEGLHLSIGINHSIIEDPSLFLAMGLSAFWLWVPRLIMAILVVRLVSLWQLVIRKRI